MFELVFVLEFLNVKGDYYAPFEGVDISGWRYWARVAQPAAVEFELLFSLDEPVACPQARCEICVHIVDSVKKLHFR